MHGSGGWSVVAVAAWQARLVLASLPTAFNWPAAQRSAGDVLAPAAP
jgi:hypothetical protein